MAAVCSRCKRDLSETSVSFKITIHKNGAMMGSLSSHWVCSVECAIDVMALADHALKERLVNQDGDTGTLYKDGKRIPLKSIEEIQQARDSVFDDLAQLGLDIEGLGERAVKSPQSSTEPTKKKES